MGTKLKLPVGVEDFEKICREGYYYVDKTGLVREILEDGGVVNLFTRPRRFGKSLNMSMLKYYFEYGCDNSLFNDLEITKSKELCEAYMGRFPVISVTLKDVYAGDFDGARNMLKYVIGNEALRFRFLLDSGRISVEEKAQYRRLITIGEGSQPMFVMSDDTLAGSLRLLSGLLRKHYGRRVILLIDEYDVPLDKAEQSGCYDEMAALIRNLLSQALKTNVNLQLAVLTGCLRIAKESVFTGLNNLKVRSIDDEQFGEYFGFSDGEVRDMLEYYGFEGKYDQVRTWYDGYCFGKTGVYCPWDVINYCAELCFDPDTSPKAYWVNTSGNDIIRRLLQKAAPGTRQEMERLVNGETVTKRIRQELTYRELYENADNMWSVLYTTGYLTRRGKSDGNVYQLAIPNLEIRQIFVEHVLEWFQETARRDAPKLDAFCAAFLRGDGAAVEEQFSAYLRKTISIRDTAVKGKKENFYHGILLGLLSHREDWYVFSNAESGDGFSDILVEAEEENIGIVIEVKYPDENSLETGCREALQQIEKMGYEDRLREDGMETIIRYGIACNRKKCRVAVRLE